MYKKLYKTFFLGNFKRFILLILTISISLIAFLVSDSFVNNVKTLIGNESKPILGGDIKLKPSSDLSLEQLQFLENLENNGEIEISKRLETFTSIENKSGEISLAGVLFVENNFPFYGNYETEKLSNTGTTFVNKDLYEFLNLKEINLKPSPLKGETERGIKIFGKQFNISGVITKFPESSINPFSPGNRIVMDISDFKTLGLSFDDSLIEVEYLIKVENNENFDNILSRIKDNPLFEKVRINDYKRGTDRFENIFSELDKFIKYIIIISFFITVIIIFFSVESFFLRNKKAFSILRILGMKNKSLVFFNITLFLSVLLVSFLISLLISYIIFGFVRNFDLSSSFFIQNTSVYKTFFLGFVIIVISTLLPIIKFSLNKPLVSIKENFLQIYTKKEIIIEVLIVYFGLIFIYYVMLGGIISSFISIFIFLFFLFILSIILKYVLNYFFRKLSFLKNKNFIFYDSVRNTIKPGNLSILLIFGFIISFSSVLFISIIFSNFYSKLSLNLETDSNLFIINIDEEDYKKIDDDIKRDAYSTFLGRISNINGIPLDEFTAGPGSRRFTREFSITDNSLDNFKIIDGSVLKSGEVSVDYNFSKDLGVKIGDEIEFLIIGKKVKLKVANIRESSYSGVTPFFYFQVYKPDFLKYPKSYFVSTYVEKENIQSFKKSILSKTSPRIAFIEVDIILQQIKTISQKILLILQVLSAYIIIFCFISLFVSVEFLSVFKKKKRDLYIILGSTKKDMKRNYIYEYIYLEIIALIFSIIIATIGAYYVISISQIIEFSAINYIYSLGIVFIFFVLFLVSFLFVRE